MKRLNITVPDNVYHLLLTQIGKGKISSFLAKMLVKNYMKMKFIWRIATAKMLWKTQNSLMNECTEIEDWT